VDEIAKIAGANQHVDLGPIRDSLGKLTSAAENYEKAFARLDRLNAQQAAQAHAQLAALDLVLYRTERAFRHEAGLPRREWFKHLIYAPGFYTGYGVKTLPGIREGIEEAHWDEARSFVPVVAKAIEALTSDVNRATAALRAIVH
jgi:N-acetylated-alpha-linked acidic dipeptidase